MRLWIRFSWPSLFGSAAHTAQTTCLLQFDSKVLLAVQLKALAGPGPKTSERPTFETHAM